MLEPLRIYSAEPPTSADRWRRYSLPSTVSASLLVHAAVFLAVSFALEHMPHTTARPLPSRYALRVIEAIPTPPEPLQYSAAAAASGGAEHAAAGASAGHAAASSARARLPLAATAEAAPSDAAPAPVLIQPDLPKIAVLHPPPVPSVVLWSADKTTSARIVPPPPQPPPASLRKPSIAPPLREPRIADISISSTAFKASLHLPEPATTAPIVRPAPAPPVQSLPHTAVAPSRVPSPARILSLSDLRMPGGPIALPPVNSAGGARVSVMPSPASTTAGSSGDASAAVALPGSGTHTADNAHGAGNGTGTAPGASGQGAHGGSGTTQLAANGAGSGSHPGHGGGNGASNDGAGGPGGSGTHSSPGNGSGDAAAGAGLLNATHLVRPHDGQFGFVVLGSNVKDTYPDIPDVWNGRLMYSVYLPMSQGKSWILQYSLPDSPQAAAAGGRPDAPWPYDMMRPDRSAADSTGDPILIHGIVNATGHFEQLAVVFPAETPEATSVLRALKQWIFRPSRQNGRPVAVEVLLIVPALTE